MYLKKRAKLYWIPERSYVSKFRQRMFCRNTSGNKLKSRFPLSQLKNWQNNERKYFRKYFIKKVIINLYVERKLLEKSSASFNLYSLLHTFGIGIEARFQTHQAFPQYCRKQMTALESSFRLDYK